MSHASDGDLHDNPQTRGMAEFVSGLAFEAVPAEVLKRLKLLMLDSVGVSADALTAQRGKKAA